MTAQSGQIKALKTRIKTLEEKGAADGGGPGAYKSGGAQGAEEDASSPEDDKDEM